MNISTLVEKATPVRIDDELPAGLELESSLMKPVQIIIQPGILELFLVQCERWIPDSK